MNWLDQIFATRCLQQKVYGHENQKTQNTFKSGTAKHMLGRTTVKSGTALAVLAVLVAPHLATNTSMVINFPLSDLHNDDSRCRTAGCSLTSYPGLGILFMQLTFLRVPFLLNN